MHYPLIDYYRFFAATLVCISHYYITINKEPIFELLAFLGVEFFFALSGFVLEKQIKN